MPHNKWDGQNAKHIKKSRQNANLQLAFCPVGILSYHHHVNSVNHVSSVNHVNSVNPVDSVRHVNSVNSVNSYCAVLPPSPMVFLFIPKIAVTVMVLFISFMMLELNEESGHSIVSSKAFVTLGLVMGAFLLCWFPFFLW